MTDSLTLAPGEPRGRFARGYFRYALEPWLYLGPGLLLIGLVILVPLAIGISYSFRAFNLLRPDAARWVRFENYVDLWEDARFWRALRNTLLWTFASLALQLSPGLGLALLLNT